MVTVGVMSPAVLAAYAATVFVLMITPGPDMLFTLGAGIRSGPRAGFCAAVGAACGEAFTTMPRRSTAAGLAAGRLGSWLAARRGAPRKLDVATGSIYLGLAAKIVATR